MDPTFLALLASGLGAGLFEVIKTLATKGVVEPGLKPLSEILEGKWDKKKAEAQLLDAVKKAVT